MEHKENDKIKQLEVVVDAPDDNADKEESALANELIRQSFQKLPRVFFPTLERVLEEKLLKLYPDTQRMEKITAAFTWSDGLMRRNNRWEPGSASVTLRNPKS